MAFDKDEFYRQYQLAQQNGMSGADAYNYVKQNYTQPVQQQAESTPYTDKDQFYAQYQAAKQSGLTSQEAYNQVKSGKRFGNEIQTWNPQTDYSDAYEGKNAIQRAGTRVTSAVKGAVAEIPASLATTVGKMSQGLRTVGAAMPWATEEDKQRAAVLGEQDVAKARAWGEPLRQYSQQQMEKATYGIDDSNFLGKAGKFMIEMIPSGIGMVADAATGLGLANMAARVYGGAYNNAVDRGADADKANLYGIIDAGIEVATEMIGGEAVMNKLAYGNKGLLNSAIENTIAKIGSNHALLQKIALWGMSGASEGLEEVVSEVLNPLAESILEDDYGKALVASLKDKYVENPRETAFELLRAALGGVVMSIGGGAVADVGVGTVNTLRGVEKGQRTVSDQQLAQINAKYGIEQNPEAVKAYQEAEKAGKSEGEALMAGQNVVYDAKTQSEYNKILDDYILGRNGMTHEIQEKHNDAYDMVSNEFSKLRRNDVLLDKNGNAIGRVVMQSGKGYVIRFRDKLGAPEAVFKSSTSGSIDPDGRVYATLRDGGKFIDAQTYDAIKPKSAPQPVAQPTVQQNPQQMATQQEVAPQTPSNMPAPETATAQATEQPAPDTAPKYQPGETVTGSYKGMPVQIRVRKDGKGVTVYVPKTSKKDGHDLKTYRILATARDIDEANRLIAKHYTEKQSGQQSMVDIARGKAPRDNTSTIAPESPVSAPKKQGSSTSANTSKSSTEQTQKLVTEEKKSEGRRYMAELDSDISDSERREQLRRELNKAQYLLDKIPLKNRTDKNKKYIGLLDQIKSLRTELAEIDARNRPTYEHSESKKSNTPYIAEDSEEGIEYYGREAVKLSGKQLNSVYNDGNEVYDEAAHNYFDRTKALTPKQVEKLTPIQVIQRLSDWAGELRLLGKKLNGFSKWYTDITTGETLGKGDLGAMGQRYVDEGEMPEDTDFGTRGRKKQSIEAQSAAQKDIKATHAMALFQSLEDFARANTFGYGNTKLLDAIDWILDEHANGREIDEQQRRNFIHGVEVLVGRKVEDWSKASVKDAINLIAQKYPALVDDMSAQMVNMLPDDAKKEIDSLLARAKTITLASTDEKAEIANEIAYDPDNPEAYLAEYEKYRHKKGRENKTLASILDGEERYTPKSVQKKSEFDYWDVDMEQEDNQDTDTDKLSLEEEERIENSIYEALKDKKNWLFDQHGELPYETTMLLKEGSKSDEKTDLNYKGKRASHDNFMTVKSKSGDTWVLKRGQGILRNLSRSHIAETLTSIYNNHQETLRNLKQELKEKEAKLNDLRARYQNAGKQNMILPGKNVEAGKNIRQEVDALKAKIEKEQALLDRFDNKEYKAQMKKLEELAENRVSKESSAYKEAQRAAAASNYTLSKLYGDNVISEDELREIINSTSGVEREINGFQIANLKAGMNAQLASDAIRQARKESEERTEREQNGQLGGLPDQSWNGRFLAGSEWQQERAAAESDEQRAERRARYDAEQESLRKNESWIKEQEQRSTRIREAAKAQERRNDIKQYGEEAVLARDSDRNNSGKSGTNGLLRSTSGGSGQEVGGNSQKLTPSQLRKSRLKAEAQARNQKAADAVNNAPEVKGFPTSDQMTKTGRVTTVRDMGDQLYVEGKATAGVTGKNSAIINDAFDELGMAVAGIDGNIYRREGKVNLMGRIFTPSVGRTLSFAGFVENGAAYLKNITGENAGKVIRYARHEAQHKITGMMFQGEDHDAKVVAFAKKIVTDAGLDYETATTKLREVYNEIGSVDDVQLADEVLARIADGQGFGTDASYFDVNERGKEYVNSDQAVSMYIALTNSTEWNSTLRGKNKVLRLFENAFPEVAYGSSQSEKQNNFRADKYIQLVEDAFDARVDGDTTRSNELMEEARSLYSQVVLGGETFAQRDYNNELKSTVNQIEKLVKSMSAKEADMTEDELNKLLFDIKILASGQRPSGMTAEDARLRSKYQFEAEHGQHEGHKQRRHGEGLKPQSQTRIAVGQKGDTLGQRQFMADLDADIEAGEGVPYEDRLADWNNKLSSEEYRAMLDEYNAMHEDDGSPNIIPKAPSRKYVDEDTWQKEWNDTNKKELRSPNPFNIKDKKTGKTSVYGNIENAHRKIHTIANKGIFQSNSVISKITGDNKLAKATADRFRSMSLLIDKVITGEKSATELYHFMMNMKNTPGMNEFISDYTLEMFRRAEALEQAAYDSDLKITEGSAAYLFRHNVDAALTKLAADVERTERISYREKIRLIKNAQKNGKGEAKTALGRGARWLNSMQMSAANWFKSQDGYDKEANGEGYAWADRHQTAVANKVETQAKAFSFFEKSKDTEGFKDFAYGKAKGKYGTLLSELSLLKSLETLRKEKTDKNGKAYTDWSKVYNRERFDITDTDGKTTSIQIEGDSIKAREKFIENLYKELQADIKGNAAASQYKQDMEDMFEYLSPFLQKTSANLGFLRKMSPKGTYFPLSNADADFDRQSDIGWSLEDEMGIGISGFGHMKTRYGDTYNLQIMPASQVVDAYIQQATNYIAFAELGADLKVLTNTESATGNYLDVITKSEGEAYARWLKNYTRDMNMIKAEDQTGAKGLLAKARTRMMQGALLGSVSVPIKQTASYYAASGIIDPRALRKAWMPVVRRSGNNIVDYVYKSRTQGSIDPDVSQALKSGWVEKLRRSGKIGAAVVNATNIMDSRTVANLYLAACYDIEMNSGLSLDQIYKDRSKLELTNAGELLVHAKFTEAVLNSQPVFTRQARAEIARTNSELLRMLSVFRTQQTQNYNRILTTVNEYNAAMKGKNTQVQQAATKELKQTLAGQAASAASLAILTTLSDIILHKWKKYKKDDDEDKFDPMKVLDRVALNTIETAAGTTLFGGEISKWLVDQIKGNNEYNKEFYGISMGAISSLTGVMDSWNWLRQNYEKYGDRYLADNMKTVVNRTATLMGIPLQNAYNIMNLFYQYAGDIMGKDIISGYDNSKYDDFMKEFDKLSHDYGNQLYNAYKAKNQTKAKKAVEDMGDDYESTIWYTCLNNMKAGKMDDEEAYEIFTTYGGKEPSEAKYAVQTLHLNIDTGYTSVTSDGDKSAKTAYINGKLSRDNYKTLLMKYGSKNSTQADNYIDKIDVVQETGYEENKRTTSDLDSTYEQKAKKGVTEFYKDYGNQFESPKAFGDVFNYLNNNSRTDFPEYKSLKGNYTASANQSRAVTLLNDLIKQKKITYAQARLIWTEHYGWSTTAYSQWHNVKAA